MPFGENVPVEFIAWFRSETTIFTIFKSLEEDATTFTNYRVSIEPADATESVLYFKKEADIMKFYEASFEGLIPGRKYKILVQAQFGDSFSLPTVAPYRTVPSRPVNLTVDEASTTSNGFRVKWESPNNTTDFDEYEVTFGSDAKSFTSFQQYVPRSFDNSIYTVGTHKNVEPGQTYQVTVKTVSGNVTSWPETVNVTTKPLPVENLRSSINYETGLLSISWQPNSASIQNEYKISYSDVESNDWGRMNGDSMNTNQTNLVLEQLLPSRNYSLSVQAISNHILSDKSTIYVLTPPSNVLMYL